MDPSRCEVCDKAATVHLCEISNGQKAEHHYCAEHAGSAEVPAMNPEIFIRQAISFCQMMVPPEKQTRQNVTDEVRRIVERCLENFADDARAFGFQSDAME